MEYGLYEKILKSKFIEKENDIKYKETRNIDNSELARVLSIEYQKIIRETLLQIENNVDRVEFIEKINKIIKVDGFEHDDENQTQPYPTD